MQKDRAGGGGHFVGKHIKDRRSRVSQRNDEGLLAPTTPGLRNQQKDRGGGDQGAKKRNLPNIERAALDRDPACGKQRSREEKLKARDNGIGIGR